MKHNLYLNILFVIIAVLFFSCSDWEKDPTKIIKAEPVIDEPTEVLMPTNFPDNITALCLKENGVFLAGSSDGFFYKSCDFGKSWIKTGVMTILGKVNCFGVKTGAYSIISTDTSEKYVTAATTRGGYLSTDLGSSWKYVLPAEGINGSFRELTYSSLEKFTNNNIPTYSILFKGFDGLNTIFQDLSVQEGKYNNINWFIGKESVELLEGSWIVATHILAHTYDITVYSNRKKSLITCQMYLPSKSFLFDEDLESTTALLVKKTGLEEYVFFVNTKKGVIISSDGLTWKNNFPKEIKVYSFSMHKKTNFLYAGAGDGLYLSFNYGASWMKADLWKTTEAVTLTAIFNDYLYLVSGSGKTYCVKLTSATVKNLFVPDPLTPYNNSICTNSPLLEWVKTDDENRNQYELQISSDLDFKSILIDTTLSEYKYQTNLKKSESKYYWRVRSSRIWGYSIWSVIFSFIIEKR